MRTMAVFTELEMRQLKFSVRCRATVHTRLTYYLFVRGHEQVREAKACSESQKNNV
jgi:hypothetical protein